MFYIIQVFKRRVLDMMTNPDQIHNFSKHQFDSITIFDGDCNLQKAVSLKQLTPLLVTRVDHANV